MELVKNKSHDPQQLLSASSLDMLGAAKAAPRDKSISPLPSSPMGHHQATHPGSLGSAAAGIQGWSLSWTQAERHQGPQTTACTQKPPCTEPPAKPSLFTLAAWGLGTGGGYFHPSEASKHRAATYCPSGSQNCILQPLLASRPSQEHHPSPAGETPAGCSAARTANPQGSSPQPGQN